MQTTLSLIIIGATIPRTDQRLIKLTSCLSLKIYNCIYKETAFSLPPDGVLRHLDIKNTSFPNNASLRCIETLASLSNENIINSYNAIATGNETIYTRAFKSKSELKNITLKDTSKVTDFVETFSNCRKLEKIDNIDFSSCKNASGTFQECNNLKEINGNLNFSQCNNLSSMFSACHKLYEIGDLDLSSCTSMYNAFSYCLFLRRVGNLITPNVQNFQSLFQNCVNLKTIESIDLNSCTRANSMFAFCCSLQNIASISNIKISGIDFSPCINLNHASLIRILNALHDYSGETTTYTLILGATNLAKLTEEEIAIGTSKGWTIS